VRDRLDNYRLPGDTIKQSKPADSYIIPCSSTAIRTMPLVGVVFGGAMLYHYCRIGKGRRTRASSVFEVEEEERGWMAGQFLRRSRRRGERAITREHSRDKDNQSIRRERRHEHFGDDDERKCDGQAGFETIVRYRVGRLKSWLRVSASLAVVYLVSIH